jgi:hypothetical protein
MHTRHQKLAPYKNSLLSDFLYDEEVRNYFMRNLSFALGSEFSNICPVYQSP